MRLRNTACFTVVVGLAVSALAQAPRRDGRWEVKTEMEMPGMPMKMPAMTSTQCITKEQVEDPQRSVPQGRGAPNNCKVSDYKVTGNKVTSVSPKRCGVPGAVRKMRSKPARSMLSGQFMKTPNCPGGSVAPFVSAAASWIRWNG